jgi:hypothetical protein
MRSSGMEQIRLGSLGTKVLVRSRPSLPHASALEASYGEDVLTEVIVCPENRWHSSLIREGRLLPIILQFIGQ